MKSLMLLTLESLLTEYGDFSRVCTTRDWQYISSRIEDEGLSFVTIVLPRFGKGLERALTEGGVAYDTFPGFKKVSSGVCLPAFLQGFTRLVFNAQNGTLLENPDVDAIRAIRQITAFAAKVQFDVSPTRVKKAFTDYLTTEEHVRKFDQVRSPLQEEDFAESFFKMFWRVLAPLEQLVNKEPLVPKHGPGSTADRKIGHDKYRHDTWPTRLEKSFPPADYILPSERYYQDIQELDMLSPGSEIPVRVISVPKTMETRRIIAIEPTAMQFAQQSIMTRLVPALEADPLIGPLIGFSDQEPNRNLAQLGSITGALATLDLSSASDLVSNQLVLLGFDKFRTLSSMIQACRSQRADVPGVGIIRLAKFASMGSALCFPIEAMVFLTIAVMAIAKKRNVPVTPRLLKELKGCVRVYGDDIIVPTDMARSVIDSLEAFGFKVGRHKSFWSGNFRESCGGDYYLGEDITPIRCRQDRPLSLMDAEMVASTVSLRNQCFRKGLWQTASMLDLHLNRVLLGHFPSGLATSSGLVRESHIIDYDEGKFDENLHIRKVRMWEMIEKPSKCKIDGPNALLHFFLMRDGYPLQEGWLEHSGRPKSVNLRLRGRTVY